MEYEPGQPVKGTDHGKMLQQMRHELNPAPDNAAWLDAWYKDPTTFAIIRDVDPATPADPHRRFMICSVADPGEPEPQAGRLCGGSYSEEWSLIDAKELRQGIERDIAKYDLVLAQQDLYAAIAANFRFLHEQYAQHFAAATTNQARLALLDSHGWYKFQQPHTGVYVVTDGGKWEKTEHGYGIVDALPGAPDRVLALVSAVDLRPLAEIHRTHVYEVPQHAIPWVKANKPVSWKNITAAVNELAGVGH